ncbi:hypothetical protein Sbs19_18330 [Sphingobium sp. BS19]|nr:hypothetical protein Sbs19_18330 [Sphingobium sp. BS19]
MEDGEIKAAPDIGTYVVGKTGLIRTARKDAVWRLLSIIPRNQRPAVWQRRESRRNDGRR